MVQNPPSDNSQDPLDPLVEQAVSWLVHLHSGEETAADWDAYHSWRSESEENRAAAEHAEAIWDRIGNRKLGSRGQRTIPLIFLAFLTLGALAFAFLGSPLTYFADYRAGVGELRTVRLFDRVSVDMDTTTSFNLDRNSQGIELLDGRIFVSLDKGGAAFVVKTPTARLQTLGTKFAVRREGDDVAALVEESAILFDVGKTSIEVRAGQAARFTPDHGLEPAAPVDVAALTAWRRKELVFRDRTLGHVVRELGRYRWGRILVVGDEARELRVTGAFDVEDPDSALRSLALALPIRIRSIPGLAIITLAHERIR